MAHAEINGSQIAYRRSGQGHPVLFLHAGVADSRMWEEQAVALGDRFDCIRPDMRGFGDSPLPPHPWSPARDASALIDALELPAVHIVACSMGGSTAIDLTLSRPDRVSRLMLVGSGVNGRSTGDRDAALFAAVEEADKRGDLDAVNQAEADLWLDGPGRPSGHTGTRLRALFLDMNGRSLHNDWSAAPMEKMDPPAAGRLAEIRIPTLVVVGAEDLPHVVETSTFLEASITGAKRVVIPDAAHLPNLEHPELFNSLLLEFLGG